MIGIFSLTSAYLRLLGASAGCEDIERTISWADRRVDEEIFSDGKPRAFDNLTLRRTEAEYLWLIRWENYKTGRF